MECPLGCGSKEKYSEEDLANHVANECRKACLVCKKCNGEVFREEIEGHDCLAYLKKQVEKLMKGGARAGGKEVKNGAVRAEGGAMMFVDEDDSNHPNVNFAGCVSKYFGLKLSIGKSLKPEDTHTLMPQWPSRWTLAQMAPGVKQQLFIEKIKYFVDDSIKSL